MNDKQSRKIIKEIPVDEMASLFVAIRRAIFSLGSNRAVYIRREDIYIAMPEYMLKMLEHYLIATHGMYTNFSPGGKLEGCEIIPHYKNEIVVFYKFAIEAEVEPAIIPIP